jgi:predicted dehydrogenase
MLAAHRQAGTLLAINWPLYWKPSFREACRRITAGDIGHVFHATIRMAHEGPREMGCTPYFYEWLYDAEQNGGGALIDYCCYGAAAARQLFGRPRAVMAVSGRLVKTDIPVEDNASITMLYDQRFVVTEASWTERPWYHDAIFRGTAGTLWTSHGKLYVDRSQQGGPPEEVACPPLAKHEENGPAYVVHCLTTGEPLAGMISPEVSRDAQEILDAGQRSATHGERIGLPG